MKKFRKLAWDTVLLTKIQVLLKLKKKKILKNKVPILNICPKLLIENADTLLFPNQGLVKQ